MSTRTCWQSITDLPLPNYPIVAFRSPDLVLSLILRRSRQTSHNSVNAGIAAIGEPVKIDLRTTGLLRLGVSTDATRAKAHREGQQLSKAVYGAFAVDGLLYSSRLTSAECLAVYDRAVDVKMISSPAVDLVRHPDLVAALESIGVAIRRAP